MVDHESKSTTVDQIFEVVDEVVIQFMESMAEVDCKSIEAVSHFESNCNPPQHNAEIGSLISKNARMIFGRFLFLAK